VTLRALIVDDEAPARRRLGRMLAALGVVIAGEAENGDEALALLQALRPDVLFLDIQMPGLDGIGLARAHVELPAIVFVTAWDRYAVQAFEVEAVDYLLKPVRPERLAEAVERLRSRRPDGAAVARTLDKLSAPSPRVVSTSRGVVRLFDAEAITRFRASDKYTVFRADGEEHLTEESLDALELRLAGKGFQRVHRSELVRLDAITALHVSDGLFEAELRDGQHARVSRRSMADLRRALGVVRVG
jgi:DNA-binding LytR/AlgR family response regulator